jgi:hypothetical protein
MRQVEDVGNRRGVAFCVAQILAHTFAAMPRMPKKHVETFVN